MSNLWKEQFDKEIAFEEYGDRSCIFCGHDHYARLEGGNELVKDFISKELELAKKEERERIVEAIKDLRMRYAIMSDSKSLYKSEALDQVINLINK